MKFVAGRADFTVETQLPVRVQLAGTFETDQTDQGALGEGGGSSQGEGERAISVAAAYLILDAGLYRNDVPQSQQLRWLTHGKKTISAKDDNRIK